MLLTPVLCYRSLFPLVRQCVYLNSNATGAVPQSAKAALDEYWRTIEQWRDEAWRHWLQELDSHAGEIAALIGAPVGSVICDTNVATLLSRVLSCFDFRERPDVVTTDLEFPSVPFVLRAFARYGAVLTIVQSPDGIAIDPEQVAEAINERTELVCVSHATFATGALLDIAPIVRRARQVGALVALDAYQSIGTVPISVEALDVDFIFGGAHKWLCGSCESAFLYVRPSLIQHLEPAATGWMASSDPLSFETPGVGRTTRVVSRAVRLRSCLPYSRDLDLRSCVRSAWKLSARFRWPEPIRLLRGLTKRASQSQHRAREIDGAASWRSDSRAMQK